MRRLMAAILTFGVVLLTSGAMLMAEVAPTTNAPAKSTSAQGGKKSKGKKHHKHSHAKESEKSNKPM